MASTSTPTPLPTLHSRAGLQARRVPGVAVVVPYHTLHCLPGFIGVPAAHLNAAPNPG